MWETLGTVRDLDHIGLRTRGDGNRQFRNRFTRMKVDLYEQPPDLQSKPTWSGP